MITEREKGWVLALSARLPGLTLSFSDKIRIEAVYREIYGQELRQCNCQHVYTDAVVELAYQLKRMEMGQKYEMKRGVIVHHKGETYSRLNMTDKVAKDLLKHTPGASVLFDTIPQPDEQEPPKPRARKLTNKPAENE